MEGKGITKMASMPSSAVSRRSFLQWSALATGAMAIAGNAGCSNGLEEGAEEPSQGKWVSAQCTVDCGSRGFNKVYVVDGKPRRMGTDETVPDTAECPRLRSCARGRAGRQYVFGADRLKYPMKRKNWQPGGGDNAHGELRGIDEWERITWDEALDYVAGEIKRIVETYGNEAIVMPGFVASIFGQWDVGRTLSLYGGYVEGWGSNSNGAWCANTYIGLAESVNDRFDLMKSDLIVLWGSNPAWSRAGMLPYIFEQAKEKGVRFISIDPFRNPTASVLSEEWVPVRPGTDTALGLAMAYAILEEDENQGGSVIDWDFLDRCTIGFDAEHMPEGSDSKENFKDYVLGTYDGVPKTPEWASEICGTPADTIRRIALDIAKTEKVGLYSAPAPARTTSGYAWPQTFMALGAMSGCIGKSGCFTASDSGHVTTSLGGSSLVMGGVINGEPSWTTAGGRALIPNPVAGVSPSPITGFPNGMFSRPVDPYVRINNNELWTSVVSGEYTAGAGDVRKCKTKMFYHTHSNHLNQAVGTMLGIEAHRKVEFVVTQNVVMATTAKYSDIVLPVTTQWEREGMLATGLREHLTLSSQVTEPLFEAKDDLWIAEELADRLGVDRTQVNGHSRMQELYNQVSAALVATEDGTGFEPLVSFTAEEIAEMGVEGEPREEGRISYTKFKEDGIYQVPRSDGDPFCFIALKAFREDPEANPLATESGKLEIYCKTLADDINACGWSIVSPLPKYAPGIEGYEETYDDWNSKTKGEFPFQLITLHTQRFVHSNFGNTAILREAFDHPLYMNRLDGESAGLASGDTVLVSSKWGKVLRPVLLTDAIMPGVTALGEGAWVDIDEDTGIDRAGCANVLVGPNPVAYGHQSFNSCIVKVEKYAGDSLEPDAEWTRSQPIEEE